MAGAGSKVPTAELQSELFPKPAHVRERHNRKMLKHLAGGKPSSPREGFSLGRAIGAEFSEALAGRLPSLVAERRSGPRALSWRAKESEAWMAHLGDPRWAEFHKYHYLKDGICTWADNADNGLAGAISSR